MLICYELVNWAVKELALFQVVIQMNLFFFSDLMYSKNSRWAPPFIIRWRYILIFICLFAQVQKLMMKKSFGRNIQHSAMEQLKDAEFYEWMSGMDSIYFKLLLEFANIRSVRSCALVTNKWNDVHICNTQLLVYYYLSFIHWNFKIVPSFQEHHHDGSYT